MSLPFSVASDVDGSIRVVSVSGELDQATAPSLRTELTTALDGDGAVIVNLRECSFIDSTGLSLLIEAQRHLADGARRFAVCCPDDEVRRLLELTGIDRAIALYETRDDAVAALANGGGPG